MTKQKLTEREAKISKILAEFAVQKCTGYHAELAMSKIVDLIGAENRKALSSHEAEQWHPYPQEKPEYGKKYLCTDTFGKEAFECKYVSPKNWQDYGIIAFRELPAPYQTEGKESDPFRPTTDSNPKAFKP